MLTDLKEGDTIWGVCVDSHLNRNGNRVNQMRFFLIEGEMLYDITQSLVKFLGVPKNEVREKKGTGNVVILCDDHGYDIVHGLSRKLFPKSEKPGLALKMRRV